ncbi:serine protease [Micromonospora sp. WMMD975]|uniref:S1 family peptidase n=1 Tax=Micromonospora sp. WMMD975 TaxID=3016087 RepID=UPI00249CE7C4|nr:serine protease [Micromonospora sp. WMMD975]WFE31699.1 serine protease [Micromonospora sp. WMMD975]
MQSVASHIARLALVQGARRGSGHVVGRNLILTAGHVVGPLGATCRVRVHGDAERDGAVVWRADHLHLDAALVQVPQAGWPESTPDIRYGELAGPQPVECLTVGYPLASVDADGRSGVEEHAWLVAPGTGVERDRYALNSVLTPPHERVATSGGPRSGWAGQSGAALLSGDGRVVLGVVVADPNSFGPGRLEAVRVSSLMRDGVFGNWVGVAPDDVVRLTAKGQADEPQLPPGIVPHADEVAGLDGLLRNLQEECLPFVPPMDATAPTHPDRLLERLNESAGRSGVLLVGAAGAGKTRTCFEVGMRAEKDGWTVLHVKSGEPLVTNADVAEALQSVGSERTLVILDYLNECRGLDLPGLRQQVLPEARRHGTRAALLASARPGWQLQTAAELTPLFDLVRLAPDDQQAARIRQQVVTSLSPTALAMLGEERLLELCGSRPIIAMLVALEAETRAKAGTLNRALPSVRPGELVDWLNRRLREDGLLPQAVSLISDPEPSVELQTCVAMAVAAPQERTSLIACGGRVAGGDTERAEHLLGILLTMGWLVPSFGEYTTVHDIVTDQLTESTFHRPGSGTVRSAVADRILAASLTRGRTIGRYATNLGRLMRDLTLEQRSGPLQEHCRHWLEGHEREVGGLLAEQQDEGAYALGAVMDNPSWSPVAFGRWDTVVAPWLAVHARTFSARHLLYKGLRASVSDDRLVRESIEWLAVHHRAEATFVLRPLLQRELSDEQAAVVVRRALAWLDDHATTLNAQFVLQPLLDRELSDEQAAKVVRHALAWLDDHAATFNARFVLQSLLSRELSGGQADVAVRHALAWLDDHLAALDAGFVLCPLLGRELSGGQASVAVRHALAWLDDHAATFSARFVLRSLLDRDLSGEQTSGVVRNAVAWLDDHAMTLDAQYVLRSLLERELSDEQATKVVRHALAWLTDYADIADAGFVLRPLLQRELSGGPATSVVRQALVWLDVHAATLEGQFVLRPLLQRELPDEQAGPAVRHALVWLDVHAATLDGQFVLRPLLQRELPDGQATSIVRHGLAWLTDYADIVDAGFVLRPLLQRELPDGQAATVVRHALAWLDDHSVVLDAGFVLRPLLQHELPDGPAATVVRHALAWLAEHAATRNAGFVLQPLLHCPLSDGQVSAVVRHALAWLTEYAATLDAQFVLRPLLDRELPAEQAATVVRHALAWLTGYADTVDAGYVLQPLLQRELSDDQVTTVVGYALAWLTAHAGILNAGFVLRPLLQRELPGEQAATVVRHALVWLTAHAATFNASFVLQPLLRHRLPGEQAGTVVRHALAWLAGHATDIGARFVLRPLLQRPSRGEQAASVVRYASAWLAVHAVTPGARFVLQPLLQRELSDEQAASVVRYASAWLAVHAVTPGARFVLQPLLQRESPDEQAASVVRHASAWLAVHATTSGAGFVLQPLLRRELSDEQAASVVRYALAWLAAHAGTSGARFVLQALLQRELSDDQAASAVGHARAWLADHAAAPAAGTLRAQLDRMTT